MVTVREQGRPLVTVREHARLVVTVREPGGREEDWALYRGVVPVVVTVRE